MNLPCACARLPAGDEGTTPAVCADYQSETSVTVPSMTGEAVDVDFVLGANLLAADTVVDISASGVRSYRTLPAGAGFPGADTVMFVSGIMTSDCDGRCVAGWLLPRLCWASAPWPALLAAPVLVLMLVHTSASHAACSPPRPARRRRRPSAAPLRTRRCSRLV